MDGAVQKICCVCRRDVRQRKRTKDSRGNYYCNPCYEARLVAIRRELGRVESQPAPVNPIQTELPGSTPTPCAPTSVGNMSSRWLLIPVIAAALIGLCLDRSGAVRITAALALAGLILVVGAAFRSKGISCIAPTRQWREFGLTAMTLAVLLVAGAGMAWLGYSRAGIWGAAWMAGGVLLTATLCLTRSSRPASIEQPAAAAATPAPEPVAPEPPEPAVIETAAVPTDVVEVQRRVPRRGGSRKDVTISDLLGAEAQAEVEAAKSDQPPEPEVPVSPVTNPPVTALVENFSGLLMPHPAPVTSHIDLDHLDDPFESTPFRMSS